MESELSNRDNLILKENCDAGIATSFLFSWLYYNIYRDNIQVLFLLFCIFVKYHRISSFLVEFE